ncbi:hypothetical protein AAMO2058_001618400 [Amorphochlora amoebiformis]
MARRLRDPATVWPCTEALADLARSPQAREALSVMLDSSSRTSESQLSNKLLGLGYPSRIGDYDECESATPILQKSGLVSVSVATNCVLGLLTREGMPRPEGGGLGSLCLPQICTAEAMESEEVRSFLRESVKSDLRLTHLGRRYLENLRDTVELSFSTDTGFTCGSHEFPVSWGAYLVGGLIAMLGVLVLLSTVTEYWLPMLHRRMGDVGEAFSARRSLNRLFNLTRKSPEFRVLDGIRALSMAWVILGHELAFEASIGYINSYAALPPTGALKGWLAQILFSSRYAVDSFFFISGFLVFNSVTSRLERNPTLQFKDWFPAFVSHRWLRLTPTYMFCLLLWWKIAPLLGSGPLWFHWKFYVELCDNYWWSNLLYINNLYPFGMGENNTCFFHAWYLANDMQFYLITPLFILAFLKNRGMAVTLVLCITLASTSAAFLSAKSFNWSAADLDGAAVTAYDREGYIMPYFRIPAYLIGMLLAMAHLTAKSLFPLTHHTLDPFLATILEGVGLALVLVCVFGGVDADQARPCSYLMWPTGNLPCGSGPEWDTTERAIYASLTKPTWCFALGLLCWVSFRGQGGMLGWMLGHDAWVVPARLSFGMYLLHPIIINIWFQHRTQFFRWSPVDFIIRYFGVFSMTFFCAIGLNVLLEGPSAYLLKRLYTGRGRRTPGGPNSHHSAALAAEGPPGMATPGMVSPGEKSHLVAGYPGLKGKGMKTMKNYTEP